MDKVDIIRKHINSDDFYDLNGTEMLKNILNAMDEFAEQQVKLFAISDISKQRELLITFANTITYQTYENLGYGHAESVVNNFLKSNL